MISSRYNRIIILFTLLIITFANIAQGTFSISLPQIITSEGLANQTPVNPTGTSSSHLLSHFSHSSSTTTWTSASSTYTQTLPGCCFRSNGIPGSCETQSTCKPQRGSPATSTTVPTSNPTIFATSSPNPSPSPSHSSGQRSVQ
ncbi:hypothetical protein BPOR_0810g00010 [Botrytis porri]|uniref:Uncharacterized protein n=1 Tax=Botrytis porri TaxID=87229 RepID=A0A4Z1KMS8_9HELO|nr:hypothetical protein BPOR_0810g00010 [Botrytis porri]